jgi:ankyrin repeat protein
MLDAGVPVDLTVADGISPLLNAAGPGDEESVRLLLAAGANVHAVETRFGSQPLARAADWGNAATTRLLIAAGADVNHRSDNGTTALMSAAESGSLETVRALLAAGADSSVVLEGDNQPPEFLGKNAADLARRLGHFEIAEEIQSSVP